MEIFKKQKKKLQDASKFYSLFGKKTAIYQSVVTPTPGTGFDHLSVIDPNIQFADIAKVWTRTQDTKVDFSAFEELEDTKLRHDRDWKKPYALLINGDFTFRKLGGVYTVKATYENAKELLLACLRYFYEHDQKEWPLFEQEIVCLGTIKKKIGCHDKSPGIFIFPDGRLKLSWKGTAMAKAIYDTRLIKDEHV